MPFQLRSQQSVRITHLWLVCPLNRMLNKFVILDEIGPAWLQGNVVEPSVLHLELEVSVNGQEECIQPPKMTISK